MVLGWLVPVLLLLSYYLDTPKKPESIVRALAAGEGWVSREPVGHSNVRVLLADLV